MHSNQDYPGRMPLYLLGDDARGAILRLLAGQSSHLFQASKELGITAPGPQEDLQLLEKAVIAESFRKQRGAGGPRSSDLRLSSPRVFEAIASAKQLRLSSGLLLILCPYHIRRQ